MPNTRRSRRQEARGFSTNLWKTLWIKLKTFVRFPPRKGNIASMLPTTVFCTSSKKGVFQNQLTPIVPKAGFARFSPAYGGGKMKHAKKAGVFPNGQTFGIRMPDLPMFSQAGVKWEHAKKYAYRNLDRTSKYGTMFMIEVNSKEHAHKWDGLIRCCLSFAPNQPRQIFDIQIYAGSWRILDTLNQTKALHLALGSSFIIP